MVDLSVYGKVKSLADQQNANALQNFEVEQLQKKTALAGQALALKKQAALSGSDLPADMQFANRRMELYKIFSNDKEDAQARHLAAREFNELGYKAKTWDTRQGMSSVDETLYPAVDLNTFQVKTPDGQPIQLPQNQFDTLDGALNEIDGLGAGGQAMQPVTPQQLQQPLPPMQGGAMPPQLPVPQGRGTPQGSRILPDYLSDTAAIEGAEARARKRAELEEQARLAPGIEEAKARSGEIGKGLGEAQVKFDDFMAAAPGLAAAGNKLTKLANAATYTLGGKARDEFARQFGYDPGDKARSRAEMQNTIKVEVLPLLKATFGGQMSIIEGEWLLSTLGDDALHPSEKKAQIKARMDGWQREAERLARRVGAPAPAPDMFQIMQQPQNAPQENIRIINPKTGQRMRVPQQHLQDAINDGWKKL